MTSLTRRPGRLVLTLAVIAAACLLGVAAVVGLQPNRVLPTDGGAVPYWEAIERDDREGRPQDVGCVGECGPDNPAVPASELPSAVAPGGAPLPSVTASPSG